ncbi:phenazine biosynthesis protein PhzF [Bacterioplanes sanyensis]|uniref:Phenazine biosynthesis protein PhzF n=2 Tax=Bacterioplanes sanyensis TaxID=1249553 RepID=A0A222FGC1_9GAMM|nr:phenazine biosynthesis protein PhzF [Bacterioplanes sanyensis]
MEIEVFLVSAFTSQNTDGPQKDCKGTGGNPAGVVFDADILSDADKLAIAKEIGFSETAFVSQHHSADMEVSFFTPTDEVDFCGHATLAVFATLYNLGQLTPGRYTQYTKAGLLAVTIEADGRIVMQQRCPDYLGTLPYEQVSELMGIQASVLASTQLPIEIITTGLTDIFVAVPEGYLDKIQIDNKGLSEFCKQHSLVGLHAFELLQDGDLTASCRNFAPLVGIPEESATGSSTGALACYLNKHVYTGDGSHHFTFEQGKAMNCTSMLTAQVVTEDNKVKQVLVGGYGREIARKQVVL